MSNAISEAFESFLDLIVSYIKQGKDNFMHNATVMTNLSAKEWIRIITVVGAYLLLRPYITKYSERRQSDQLDKESLRAELEAFPHAKVEDPNLTPDKISPNVLKGPSMANVQLPEDSSDEDDEESDNKKEPKWGRKARRRQRELIKRIVEAEEKARKEAPAFDDDEDKDIEQYLT
jgi:hypothetical protein